MEHLAFFNGVSPMLTSMQEKEKKSSQGISRPSWSRCSQQRCGKKAGAPQCRSQGWQ